MLRTLTFETNLNLARGAPRKNSRLRSTAFVKVARILLAGFAEGSIDMQIVRRTEARKIQGIRVRIGKYKRKRQLPPRSVARPFSRIIVSSSRSNDYLRTRYPVETSAAPELRHLSLVKGFSLKKEEEEEEENRRKRERNTHYGVSPKDTRGRYASRLIPAY